MVEITTPIRLIALDLRQLRLLRQDRSYLLKELGLKQRNSSLKGK